MLSEKQQMERIARIKKILMVINEYMKMKSSFPTIEEISNETTIPKSSIQRYLNNDELLKELGLNPAAIKLIDDGLYNNKVEGNIKGGIESYKSNEPIKDELGHFMGSRRR